MRCLIISAVLLLLITAAASAQPVIPFFHEHHDFLMASPGAMKYGLYGFDNPALLSYVHQSDLYFTWSDMDGKFADFNKWGLFMAVPNLGFGVIQNETPLGSVTDYRLSTGFGNRSFSMGLGYGWSGGNREAFNRERLITLGLLIRPNRYISVGAAGYQTLRGKRQQVYADLALRPLGNEFITLFGDYAMQNEQRLREGTWSAGVAVEPVAGIRVTGRAFENSQFTVGVALSLGRLGFNSQRRYDKESKGMYSTYGVRLGAYDRTITERFPVKENRYMTLNLGGNLRYQRFILFDSSNTLRDILQSIDEAREDSNVNGIAINLSSLRASFEMKWEIRERLNEFRQSGKRVVIFIDRASITDYHLASVADYVVLDPQGNIELGGFILGTTYLKGTLAKLGIAFDEWRFFEYKSAAESLARDSMSDADREQRQRIIDHFYELVRSDVTSSRNISADEFDRIVDEEGYILPEKALELGLADTLARAESLGEIIKKLEGRRQSTIGRAELTARHLPFDNRWSEPPQIAVIYALGVCAMDEGISARSLVRDIRKAAGDGSVKAIVFRVDSPGGDPLASDIVAEALKKAMDKKPVIVSQGQVAASGGYWISMYSDTIIAAPNTVTGSIGVIGGWMYNDGLKEYLGLSTDFVKRGASADMSFGPTLPLLGLSIPDRNLNEDERARMEKIIKGLYDQFISKVAAGRGVEEDAIRLIAQGRIWSGIDGKENGLVDELGGLADAIRVARERAGIKHGEEVKIVEYPAPRLFDMSAFMPRLFGVEIRKPDPVIDHLLFRARHNGEPLPILPLEYIENTMFDY